LPNRPVMTGLNVAVRKLMEGENIAALATINPDGSPQVTPTWIDTDGEHLLVNTAMGRVKQKNTARDQRVAVYVIDKTDPYLFVAVRGRVIAQITGQPAEDHANRLAKKYLNVEKYPKNHRGPGERRVILKIVADHIYIPDWH
jgi:PPOX class probable F420-dependent enzyme